ncbi:DegT/DnrJ/EryC1/StrS aminotransferase family protein [Candidatus Saccharibacteria bacterium]|nr:DegT/DnrJ/EryC1/StrS aminotransferase family protein [Candidatus Saccharibacteria bacterium]
MKLPGIHRHYYLGMAVNHASGEWLKYLFTVGKRKDYDALTRYLSKRYKGEAILCKNGRSALAIALKTYFKPGDKMLVNGFTCFAVYEAIKAAQLEPVFIDIDKKTLNYNIDTLARAIASESRVHGIIVQNTLGNPVDIKAIEKFANEYNLTIIEDLAHCAGVRYPDRREVGTVGAACILSFGKDKSVDTVSGGAVVLRGNREKAASVDENEQPSLESSNNIPSKLPRLSDHLRARFYPMFGAMSRVLTYIGLGGALMRGLVAIHWVEKSADNKLDLKRRPSKFEAKLALRQLKELRKNGEPPLRDFCYVHDREKLLKELQKNGYYFGGFWYERPISPERYYEKVHFPESDCPNAVYAAKHIINLPNYYTCRDLTLAREVIKKYQEEGFDESK